MEASEPGTSARQHRLFVAVDVSPDLIPALMRLREELPGARWSRPEQYHLTLQFIGGADEEKLQAVSEALQEVRAPAFSLQLSGAGVFPSLRRPRVLIVRLLPEPRLDELARSVQAALLPLGIEPEHRPFNAHVTLARFKETDLVAVRSYVERHSALDLAPFPVTEFHLYESTLKSSGAEYRRLRSYPLPGA